MGCLQSRIGEVSPSLLYPPSRNTHRQKLNATQLTEYGLDLNISFEPSPDYPGIATAAGTAWGITVKGQEKLDSAIQEAANVVRGGKCAVIEVS